MFFQLNRSSSSTCEANNCCSRPCSPQQCSTASLDYCNSLCTYMSSQRNDRYPVIDIRPKAVKYSGTFAIAHSSLHLATGDGNVSESKPIPKQIPLYVQSRLFSTTWVEFPLSFSFSHVVCVEINFFFFFFFLLLLQLLWFTYDANMRSRCDDLVGHQSCYMETDQISFSHSTYFKDRHINFLLGKRSQIMLHTYVLGGKMMQRHVY